MITGTAVWDKAALAAAAARAWFATRMAGWRSSVDWGWAAMVASDGVEVALDWADWSCSICFMMSCSSIETIIGIMRLLMLEPSEFGSELVSLLDAPIVALDESMFISICWKFCPVAVVEVEDGLAGVELTPEAGVLSSDRRSIPAIVKRTRQVAIKSN